MSLSFLSTVRRFPLFLPAAKLAAAALVATLIVAPVWAQSPEVHLIGPSTGTQVGSLTFNLTCPSGRNPCSIGNCTDTENPNFYRASTYFQVRAGNVAGNAGDQEMLPDDHPGRAWGKTMWCQLWGGCTIVHAKELTIELSTSTPNITMTDSRSTESGNPITVKRKNLDWPDSVAISHDLPCPSWGQFYPVTITTRITEVRELN